MILRVNIQAPPAIEIDGKVVAAALREAAEMVARMDRVPRMIAAPLPGYPMVTFIVRKDPK